MHTNERASEAQMDNAWQTVPLLKHHLTFFTFRLHRSFCGSAILMFDVLVFGFAFPHSNFFLLLFVLFWFFFLLCSQCNAFDFIIQITTHYIHIHTPILYLLCEWENCAWLKIEILFATLSTKKNTVSKRRGGSKKKKKSIVVDGSVLLSRFMIPKVY